MGIYRFNFFIFIICDAYSQLNIENKLGFLVNHDIIEKSERQKRNREETESNTNAENLNDSSGFFSDTNDTTLLKKIKLEI
jgi:hypothetical protein